MDTAIPDRLLRPDGVSDDVWVQVMSDVIGVILNERPVVGVISTTQEMLGVQRLTDPQKQKLCRISCNVENLKSVETLRQAFFEEETVSAGTGGS